MAIDPTRYSRVSIGWVDSAQSVADQDAADTGPVASIDGPLALGLGGARIEVVSTNTQAVDIGSIAAHESSSVTVGVSGVAEGDHVLVVPDSTWTGAYYDLALEAYSTSTAGEVNVVTRNSTATAVDPDSVTMRFTAIRFNSFV